MVILFRQRHVDVFVDHEMGCHLISLLSAAVFHQDNASYGRIRLHQTVARGEGRGWMNGLGVHTMHCLFLIFVLAMSVL